jgi:RNA polymerase sigma factor (sigma-70 family)
MLPTCDSGDTSYAAPRSFLTTHWSVVLAAKRESSVETDAALERLCRTYWWPLYAFVRRRGYEPHDAQDLTQEFFARLLAKDFLQGVDRTKGKFRSFLLAALEHFLAKEWRRANAQKRGGKCTFISTAAESAEEQYLQVPSSDLSAEQLFERQWATMLLDQALAALRDEFTEAGNHDQFEVTKTFLTGEKQAQSYAQLAVSLGTTEAALKMAVSRMRKRYGQLLRAEILNTVSGSEEVDEELRALMGVLSS